MGFNKTNKKYITKLKTERKSWTWKKSSEKWKNKTESYNHYNIVFIWNFLLPLPVWTVIRDTPWIRVNFAFVGGSFYNVYLCSHDFIPEIIISQQKRLAEHQPKQHTVKNSLRFLKLLRQFFMASLVAQLTFRPFLLGVGNYFLSSHMTEQEGRKIKMTLFLFSFISILLFYVIKLWP